MNSTQPAFDDSEIAAIRLAIQCMLVDLSGNKLDLPVALNDFLIRKMTGVLKKVND